MAFETTLDMLQPPTRERTWIYVAYDQLTDEIGPLARMAPEQVGIVLVESLAKAGRRPTTSRSSPCSWRTNGTLHWSRPPEVWQSTIG